jgi:hypothetical protein
MFSGCKPPQVRAKRTGLPLRAPLPAALNYNLAIHSKDSFWTLQKDQASLSAPASTTRRSPVQTGRLHDICNTGLVELAFEIAGSVCELGKDQHLLIR